MTEYYVYTFLPHNIPRNDNHQVYFISNEFQLDSPNLCIFSGPPLAATSRSARVVSILPVANRASKSVHRCTLTAHYTFNTSESGGLYRVAFYTTSLGLNISSLLPDTAYSLVCTTLLPVHGCTSRFTQFTFKTRKWCNSYKRSDIS